MTDSQLDEINDNDIAIIGTAVRVPGAASSPQFWTNLVAGVESIRSLTEPQLLDAGEALSRLRAPNYVPAAAPLDKMEWFDAEFFGFSPKEGAILDPQHRHFLECAWEALEDAGHPPVKFDGRIGVFAGCGMGSYFYFNLCSNPDLVDSVGMFLLRHTGNDKDFLSTRLSFLLDLRGPSVNVQTACSTSLVAVHLACQSLLSGESDMALAGGVTIELPHGRGYLYQENEILSPDGHCHAFDSRAQGTVFGSGAGAVVLRRLRDAIEDRDNILAVIKGSAVNNDGSAKAGYLAPSVDGQAAAIAEALAVADVSADSIGYVECHGTGTYLGDPIEVSALTLAYRESSERNQYCRIGSVKTNIGHLDTAAGVVSLVKTAHAVNTGLIPPSLGYESPNPAIDFANSPFLVNSELHHWEPPNGPRRAAVNSLGVGGTNAHVVVQQPPPVNSGSTAAHWHLFALSARSRTALDENMDRLAMHLEQHPEQSLADVCFTLLEGRTPFNHRRALACASREQAVEFLRSRDPRRVFTHAASTDPPEVVFMFPGGGAQYVGMARGLYAEEPAFRRWADRGFEFLKDKVPFEPKAVLFPDGDDRTAIAERELFKPSVQLPLLFIIEYAMAQLLIELGVVPAALIGHSMGENTAACLAGVLSFEHALGLVLLRGQLLDEVEPGGMLSVALSESGLKERLGSALDLACVNGPELCVVSGPKLELEALREDLERDEIEVKAIPIDIAAHSRLLEPILERFGAYLRSITLSPPTIPFVSNRTGTWITAEQATNPAYWVEHLRHTVHFFDGVGAISDDKPRVLVEVGPGSVLGSLAKQHPKVNAPNVISTLRHPKDTVEDGAHLLGVRGRLWAAGLGLSADDLWPDEQRRRVSLPTYAFQRERYWIDPGAGAARPDESKALPDRIDDPERWFYEPVWRREDLERVLPEQPDSWLVFADEDGFSDELVQRLMRLGHSVITVRAGDAFARQSDTEYVLPPEHGKNAYRALFRDLISHGHVPRRILHCWLFAERESFRPGSTFFHRNLELGFFSLLFIAQAMSDEEYPPDAHFVVVTHGAQSVGDEPVPNPEQATALGPCRVIPRELPGVTCCAVDLPSRAATTAAIRPGMGGLVDGALSLVGELVPRRTPSDGGRPENDRSVHTAWDRVLAEILASPGNRTVALRGDVRWALHYERTPQAAQPTLLRRGGCYLITGGFGGIGSSIARSLAETQQAKLVMLTRSPLPPREEWDAWLAEHPGDSISDRIRSTLELESLGAKVLVVAADVADVQAVADAVADARVAFGRIDGVIHAAGVVSDGPLLAKRASDVEASFAAKIYGTRVLWDTLSDQKLDFVLLFASTSTAIAAPGQVDYVAANCYLNAFASNLRAQGITALSLNWGIWNDVGMAVAAAEQIGLVEAAAVERLAKHPWFAGVTRSRGRATVRLELSTKTHWVLDDHRTVSGKAVFPGTGYVELIRGALREVGEGPSFEIRDLVFLRPLQVADDELKIARVLLEPSDRGYTVDVQSLVDREGGTWVRHAQAQVSLLRLRPTAVTDLDQVSARCSRLMGDREGRTLRSPQEANLRFGSRWRVLEHAALGDAEGWATLRLASDFSSDVEAIGLHPGLLDLATGYAMGLIEGYDSAVVRQLWVPVTYKSIRVRGTLPARVNSWVRLQNGSDSAGDFASFDVVIADLDGTVLVEVTGLTIKRLTDPEFASATPIPDRDLIREKGLKRDLSAQERAFQHNLSMGIKAQEGIAVLRRALTKGAPAQLYATSMDLNALIQQAEGLSVQRGSDVAKFSRPQLSSDYVEPRDGIERTLVDLWQDLLGVDKIGVRDSFFDLGGHSLIAVRLFAKLNKAYSVDYPISVLFEAPTIEACANLIREVVGDGEGSPEVAANSQRENKTRYRYLVAMHPVDSEGAAPFFLVAGMFGNVLNLRQIANLIGEERPFYGVQARGLYGDDQPHANFVEMATDYLMEVRQVQPRGPYMLGGFSGGGIIAYEMARQLREAGEEVSLLVMLDTPLPSDEPLSRDEKLAIHRQNLRREGAVYPLNWVKNKLEYRRRVETKAQQLSDQQAGQSEAQFHSQVIEAAFYRALSKYDLQRQPFELMLFRPRLRPTHRLAGGQMVNRDRRRIYDDNGWSRYVTRVHVFEMPGDHDNMVLEPNVRILAAKLRQCIEQAEDTDTERAAV
jgi:acyl transferase domain-containing protein/thioesterase domain-containing protein/acyl carrier protein